MHHKRMTKITAILLTAFICVQGSVPAMASDTGETQEYIMAEETLEDLEDEEALASGPSQQSEEVIEEGYSSEDPPAEEDGNGISEDTEDEDYGTKETILYEEGTEAREGREDEAAVPAGSEEIISSEPDPAGTIEATEDAAPEEEASEQAAESSEMQEMLFIDVIVHDNTLSNAAGFVYSVYSDPGCTEYVGTSQAGANGRMTNIQLSPGTYYVRQEAAPDGFNIDPEPYVVEIQEDSIYLLNVYPKESQGEYDIGEPPLPVTEAVVSFYEDTDMVYTGYEIEPLLKVKYGTSTLTEGKDYEVTFENNVNAGTATAHVKGIGDYDFEKDFTFEIAPHVLTEEDVQTALGKYDLRYNKHAYGRNTYLVAIRGKILEKGTDYTVEGEDAFLNSTSGAEAVITGTGNCTGSVTVRIPEYDPMTVNIGGDFVYGKAIKPIVSVKIGDKTLTQGEQAGDGDYYVKSTFTSERIVQVEVIGSYEGAEIYEYKSIRISPYTLQDENVSVEKQEYEYTGSAIRPAVTVKANGKTLAENTDYALQYKNNVSKGTASVIVTGTGNFTGTVTKSFTITDAASTLGAAAPAPGEVQAQGSLRIEKSPRSYYRLPGAKYGIYSDQKCTKCIGTLKMDSDGEQTDSISLSPGTYYVRQISPPQGYGTIAVDTEVFTAKIETGTLTTLAVIFYPKTVTEITPKVTVSPSSFVYNGKTQKPSITVKNGNTVMKASDYDVTWPASVKAGTYKVTVTMKGSYSGTGTAAYKINPKKITPKVTLSKTAFTYNGKTQKPTATVKDGTTILKASDYDVTWPASVKAGTYKVTVTMKGSYSGTGTATYKINPKKITPKVTLSKTAFTYNGKAQKPAVTVKDGNTALKASDYTAAYAKGRINVGTYDVKVTLKGNYAGTKTVSFMIIPKGTSITLFEAVKGQLAFRVKWEKQSEQVTGYQVQYSTDENFKKDISSVTVKGAQNTSTVIRKNIKGGKYYYLRIRTYKTVGEKNYCSVWNYY